MALLDCLVRLAGWFHFGARRSCFGWLRSVVGWQVFASFGMVGFSLLDGSMVSLSVGRCGFVC